VTVRGRWTPSTNTPQQAEKLDARAVNDQAGKAGGAATSANDLGDDLKVFREDVLREWDGKDAEAVADHLEKLSKASHRVSDKAEAAKNILQRVSEISGGRQEVRSCSLPRKPTTTTRTTASCSIPTYSRPASHD